MNKLPSRCPCCHEALEISALSCPACGAEVKSSFALSPFDTLEDEQYTFLLLFLQYRGNLKDVQTALGISYPTAKKQLDELLAALELSQPASALPREAPDLSRYVVDPSSSKASEIIKNKLVENGGTVIVHTARGLPCLVQAAADGKSFLCDKLPVSPAYAYTVFDVIVDLLNRQGGRARKGNGRNYRLGHPQCDDTTVVGAIALHYAGKKIGDSVFDPVFVFAAILEWAGIARNGRGELILTGDMR